MLNGSERAGNIIDTKGQRHLFLERSRLIPHRGTATGRGHRQEILLVSPIFPQLRRLDYRELA